MRVRTEYKTLGKGEQGHKEKIIDIRRLCLTSERSVELIAVKVSVLLQPSNSGENDQATVASLNESTT